MSGTTSTPPIKDEEIERLKLLKLIYTVVTAQMLVVFKHGCPTKDQNKTLKEYLLNDGMTETKYKKIFNKTERELILSSPDCSLFDVSLMFKVIQVACNAKIADKNSPDWSTKDTLEYLLKVMKDERNTIFHGLQKQMSIEEVKKKFDAIGKLLEEIVNKTCDRFSLDIATRNHYQDVLDQNLKEIREQSLTQSEIQKYKDVIQLETLKTKGAEELKVQFKNQTTIRLLTFDIDCTDTLTLDTVFTDMAMITDHGSTSKDISHFKIFDKTDTASGKKACFVFMKGNAGSGKTTLLKWYKMKWAQNDLTVPGLNEYDLVVPMECRNSHIDSLTHLLKSLLPNTCTHLDDNILTYVRKLKVLFIVDGFDESNKNSNKVVDEILDLSKTCPHTILLTSRPERTREFLLAHSNELSEYQKDTLEIKGVPESKQGAFVELYHNELVVKGKSKQSTQDLVAYINTVKHTTEIFSVPQNLVNLVYLWTYRPEEVKGVMSLGKLLDKIENLQIDKVVERLVKEDSKRDIDNLKSSIKENFWRMLYIEALVTSSRDQVILDKDSKERLEKKCTDIGLDFKEVGAACFVFKLFETKDGKEQQCSFPHKDYQDNYAAKALFLAMTDSSYYQSLIQTLQQSQPSRQATWSLIPSLRGKRIRDVLTNVHNVDNTDKLKISKYSNILRHLLGLLTLQEGQMDKKYTRELVELFKEAGVTSPDQWLELLAETKCDPQTGAFLSKDIFKNEKKLVIKNENIAGYATLMPYLSPKYVELNLFKNDKLIFLDQLIDTISRKDTSVELNMWSHYCTPQDSDTNNQLEKFLHHNTQCRLVVFLGHLSEVMVTRLPSTLTKLGLAVTKDIQATTLLSHLTSLTHLKVLDIHVKASVSASILTSLPDTIDGVFLCLSEMEEGNMDWAKNVIGNLKQINKPYYDISFPLATLSLDQWKVWVDILANQDVRVKEELLVPNTLTMTPQEEDQLNDLIKTKLGGVLKRYDDRGFK